jgi:hypothetical protein
MPMAGSAALFPHPAIEVIASIARTNVTPSRTLGIVNLLH